MFKPGWHWYTLVGLALGPGVLGAILAHLYIEMERR